MMRGYGVLTTALIAIALTCPVSACIISMPVQPESAKLSDVVVVGRISNYRIVLDQKARQARDKRLSNPFGMSLEDRARLKNQKRFPGDYAKFDIVVDEALKGTSLKKLTVTWRGGLVYDVPDAMPSAPYVIALNRPYPKTQSRNSSLPEGSFLTVAQHPCSGALLFAKGTSEAATARRALGK